MQTMHSCGAQASAARNNSRQYAIGSASAGGRLPVSLLGKPQHVVYQPQHVVYQPASPAQRWPRRRLTRTCMADTSDLDLMTETGPVGPEEVSETSNPVGSLHMHLRTVQQSHIARTSFASESERSLHHRVASRPQKRRALLILLAVLP